MLSTRTTRRLALLGAVVLASMALTALVGCDLGASPGAIPSGETGTVTMKVVKSEAVAEAIPPSTVRVDVTLSAGDFAPITQTATFTAGDTEATITFYGIQVGSNRLVSVVARDQDVATQRAVAIGTALIDVYPGLNAVTTITLAATSALAEDVLAMPNSGFSIPSIVVNPDPDDPSLGIVTFSPLLVWDPLLGYVPYGDPLTATSFSVIENNDSVRAPLKAVQGGTEVDLVFVMDVSASMQEERDGVVASIEAFLADMPSHDFRLGCVSFRYDDAAPDSYLDFVADDAAGLQTFKDFVGGLTIESVGSRSENGAMGVLYAHNNLSWRPGVSRAYILITDEPIQAGTSGQDVAACVAALAGNSQVHVVSPAAFAGRPDDPKLIADGTGGAWYDLPTSGAFSLTDLGIVSAFVNYYSITYPTTLLGTEKSVTVVVNCPQGVARDTCSANWSAPWDELN